MRHQAIMIVAAVAAGGLTLGACSAAPMSASSPGSAAAATPASSPAQPVTKAAARSAAASFFALYSASQWAAAYALIWPSAKRVVTEATWARVHQRCPAAAAGLAYDIKGITLAGDTAVVRYGLSGALSRLGTAEQVFNYSHGQWWFKPSASDLATYRGHTAAQAVARMKAAGDCSS